MAAVGLVNWNLGRTGDEIRYSERFTSGARASIHVAQLERGQAGPPVSRKDTTMRDSMLRFLSKGEI